jgi:hypothetical protein
VQPGQAAWLKAYSPGDNIQINSIHKSAQGNFYLFGLKNAKEFSAKIDAKGHFKWGKLLLSPSFSVEHSSLSPKPPFTYLFSTPNTDPFIWGKLSQNDNNGTLKQLYAKAFANPLDGSFKLVPLSNKDSLLTGSLNSTVRNGPNIPNGDIAIAKLNPGNGSLAWSHIFGFDLSGMVPFASPVFNPLPTVTKWQGNYFFSRAFILKDQSTGNYRPPFAIVGKLEGTTGNLMGTPIMIVYDGTLVTGLNHLTLQDGSMIVSWSICNQLLNCDLAMIKLDNNLNLLWGKRYASAANPRLGGITLGGPTGLELADDTLEVRVFDQFTLKPHDSINPGLLHVSKVDGSVVVQKVLKSGFGARFSRKYKFGNFFSVANLYGKLDKNLSPSWVKAISGDAEILRPHNNGASHSLTGLTALGPGSQNVLFGSLNANGNVPGCRAIRNANPSFVIPDIVTTDLNPPITIHPATVTDFGVLPTQVVNAQKTRLRVQKVKLKETSICH